MSRPRLFTPDGYSPLLADLQLEQAGVYDQIVAVKEALGRLSVPQLLADIRDVFQERSRDHADWGNKKPTHVSHLLGKANPDDQYSARVWLNQYKPSDPAKLKRFTEFDHNHREGIVSLILRQGFTTYEKRSSNRLEEIITDPSVDWSAHYQALSRPTPAGYEQGQLMWLHPDEVHRLDKILPGTLSLCLRLPVQRSFSVYYDDQECAGNNPVVYPDIPSMRNALLTELNESY